MAERFISRGFVGRPRQAGVENRVPPGQYVVRDFPVLSAGPTPRTPLDRWSFTIEGLVREPVSWSWQEFQQLPSQTFVVDIHCVTKWTKLDTRWEGVSLDTLFEHVDLDPKARFLIAYSDGGYTTNLPLPDAINGQAFVGYRYDGGPLAAAPGGYQAQRSYSIGSAPERTGEIDLTVERIEDGEVSTYMHDVLAEGDQIEVRGPIGGYFVWEAAMGGPLFLVAGGSGVVPLMAMIRHRVATG